MNIGLLEIVLLAVFIEALVELVKPISSNWNIGWFELSYTQSLLFGLIFGAILKVNLFSWASMAGVVPELMSGIIVGRLSNYIFNLLGKKKTSLHDIIAEEGTESTIIE